MDKWITFVIDNDCARDYQSAMSVGAHDFRVQKISALFSAAGYLCSALDQLDLGAYNAFVADVQHLLEAIDTEIKWMEDELSRAASPDA